MPFMNGLVSEMPSTPLPFVLSCVFAIDATAATAVVLVFVGFSKIIHMLVALDEDVRRGCL